MIIQIAKDPNNMSELEKKHVPVIEVTRNKELLIVKVRVGQVEHVMTDEHYIAWVELYDGNGNLLEKRELGPGRKPEVEFLASLDAHSFIAREKCNLHGVWEGNERFVFGQD